MGKFLGVFLAALLIFSGAAGCSKSRRTVNSIAATSTYSVVYVDTFSAQDRLQLTNSIAAILSAIKADNPSVVFDITLNITKLKINNHPKGRNILVNCGEYNECPDLYERLCSLLLSSHDPKHSNRGRQIAAENRRRNGH